MPEPLTIGDSSRDGLLTISDTYWDSNGTMHVTIREMIGQAWEDYPGGRQAILRKARRLARRAIDKPELTRSSRVIRTWWKNGQSHVTFAVSRLPRT